jgi:guanine deaminase
MDDTHYMKRAVRLIEKSIAAGQSPFSAIIVKDGHVVAAVHNTVAKSGDPTAHAEINAIRKAARRLKGDFSGCTIYSSCEPCPMCFSAIHWANIGKIVYGASIADAKALGFRELDINNSELALRGASVAIVPGVLREECVAAMKKWAGKPY